MLKEDPRMRKQQSRKQYTWRSSCTLPTKAAVTSQMSRVASVVQYLNKLRESKVGPSGQITKLNTLSNALRMLMSTVPEDGGDEKMKDMAVKISAR